MLRYGPREGPSNYAHPEFTPVFKDEMTAAQRQAGENVCGASDTACIYDYVVSGSDTFALRTKQARETALRDNADISDYHFINYLDSVLLARCLSLSVSPSTLRIYCLSVCLSLSVFLSVCLSVSVSLSAYLSYSYLYVTHSFALNVWVSIASSFSKTISETIIMILLLSFCRLTILNNSSFYIV